MILKKRCLFSILSSSKLALRKAMLKHGCDKEFINLISEFSLDLTEGNAHTPEVVKEQAMEHRSIVHALARSNNKGKD